MAAQLFILSAPSGAGKTSLVKQACSRMSSLSVSVSHTTRPMRPADREGVDYHFVDETVFQGMIERGDFLEHARVFDNLYGTSQSEVEKTLAAGTDVLLEIDWQGADQVRRLMPQACSIFIMPPSREILQSRLRGRASDAEDVIDRRLQEAVDDMKHFSNYEYLIINDDFELAVEQLCAVVMAKRVEVLRQSSENEKILSDLLA